MRIKPKKVDGLGADNYWTRLEKLKLLSISRRNERYRLIYVNKILNNHVENCGLHWNYTENSGRILFWRHKFSSW